MSVQNNRFQQVKYTLRISSHCVVCVLTGLLFLLFVRHQFESFLIHFFFHLFLSSLIYWCEKYLQYTVWECVCVCESLCEWANRVDFKHSGDHFDQKKPMCIRALSNYFISKDVPIAQPIFFRLFLYTLWEIERLVSFFLTPIRLRNECPFDRPKLKPFQIGGISDQSHSLRKARQMPVFQMKFPFFKWLSQNLAFAFFTFTSLFYSTTTSIFPPLNFLIFFNFSCWKLMTLPLKISTKIKFISMT